jgi:hypothetical protein
MRSLIRLAIANGVATLVMAGIVTTSAAETLDISEESFIDKWSSLVFTTGSSRVICPVTLEGTYAAASFPSVSGTRIGFVRRATIGTCAGGSARALTETLPWTVSYSSFGGTLPNITSLTLDVIGARFRISENIACEARTTEREPLRIIATRESNTVLTGIRADESVSYVLTGGFCEIFTGHLSGSGSTQGVVEEGETLPNDIGIFQDQNSTILREELGGALKKKQIEVSREGTLTVTLPRRPNGNPISIRVRFATIAPVGGLAERFAINFGATNSCQENLAMPGGGCNLQIMHRGEVAGQASRIQIQYRIGWIRILPPLQTQEFEVESK